MDAFAVARLILGAGFLAAAAVSDLRTRRVRDALWITLGSLGIGIVALQLIAGGQDLSGWLFLAAAAILYFAVFFGKPLLDEDGIHLRPVRILVLGAAAAAFILAAILPPELRSIAMFPGSASSVPDAALASMSILLLVYQGFYQLGLLRGGADAKAMMALTLLVPAYPDVAPFPILTLTPTIANVMGILFPFSLVILVDAAILFLAVPLAYLVVNAARGELELPQAFFGTKASLDRLPPHVWLMERVDRHGERAAVLFPAHGKDDSEQIAKLRAAGASRVWVQPKVPFLVPLFLGFLIAFFVGNVMLGFLTAILPHA